VDFGFLLVEKYESLYKRYMQRYNISYNWYSIPRIDRNSNQNNIKYRGIDRDCIIANKQSKRNLAEIRLSEICFHDEDNIEEDFLDVDMLNDVYSWLEDDKSKFEPIFVRKIGVDCKIPNNYIQIGFESSYFNSDHFSASCDCMLFPRWHGTDKEGVLFQEYFLQLNKYGLFGTKETTEKFLEYYLSFDWTERGEFYTTEIWINENNLEE
jgi:hypothetical protein